MGSGRGEFVSVTTKFCSSNIQVSYERSHFYYKLRRSTYCFFPCLLGTVSQITDEQKMVKGSFRCSISERLKIILCIGSCLLSSGKSGKQLLNELSGETGLSAGRGCGRRWSWFCPIDTRIFKMQTGRKNSQQNFLQLFIDFQPNMGSVSCFQKLFLNIVWCKSFV